MPTVFVLRSIVLTLLALVPAAQGVKLNGPLATGVRGSIQPYPSFSPDGKWVVYEVDDDGDHRFELYARAFTGKQPPLRLRGEGDPYSVYAVGNALAVFVGSGLFSMPLDGSAPALALDPAILSSAQVGSVILVEERQRALYVADRDGDDVGELCSVPLAGGGPPVVLSGPLAGLGVIQAPQVTADHDHVLFLATPDDPAVHELFVAPLDGSAPARELDLPLVPGGTVQFAQLAANDLVVYTADQEEDERYELFVVPLDGSLPPRKLNGPLAPGADVGETFFGSFFSSFAHLSPDGLLAAYTADQDGDGKAELYGVPLDGSRAPLRLSEPAHGSVSPQLFSPDSARVFYLSDTAAGARELFGVRADGSAAPYRLNAPLVSGGAVLSLQVSLDSQRVAYQADQELDQQTELFGVPADGSAPPVKLNLPLPPASDVYSDANLLPGYWIVGDEVAYLADAQFARAFELYAVPLTGGASRKLATGKLSGLRPAPPSGAYPRLVFLRGERELLTTTTAPWAVPFSVHPLPPTTTGGVVRFELAPSGARAVFAVGVAPFGALELDSTATDEPHARSVLHPGSVPSPPHLSPDESRVAFVASTAAGDTLYSAASDGSSAPIALSSSVERGVEPLFTRDGARLLFAAGASGEARTGMYVVPADGSAAPTCVTLALPPEASVVGPVRVSADERAVAFLLGRPSDGLRSVGVAALDGSQPARQISQVNKAVEADFELAPDGSALVYRVDGSIGRTDLFWAASDGSSAPRRLNPTLRVNGGVEHFAVDWAAGRAVYLADQQVVGLFELFSVPLDGSSPAQRLHGPLVAGGDVLDFALEPGGGSVVYRADGRVDQLAELFRVPLDGSRAPVRLVRRPELVGGVSDFQLTLDGTRVVFGATRPGGARELYSAPVRPPSAGPALTPHGLVKLSRPLVPGGRAVGFRISADSSTVVFAAQRDAENHLTLLAVPIGGEQKAVEVAGPFQVTGSVQSFDLSRDGTRIVYLADQEQAFIYELFLARHARPAGP